MNQNIENWGQCLEWCLAEIQNPDREVVFTIDDPFGTDTNLKLRLRQHDNKILVTEVETDYTTQGSGTTSYYITNPKDWLTQKFTHLSGLIASSELGYFTVMSVSLTIQPKPKTQAVYKFTPTPHYVPKYGPPTYQLKFSGREFT